MAIKHFSRKFGFSFVALLLLSQAGFAVCDVELWYNAPAEEEETTKNGNIYIEHWVDGNRNGIRDYPLDDGYSFQMQTELYNADTNELVTRKIYMDEVLNGVVRFDNVPAGRYYVKFGNNTYTKMHATSNSDLDSDVNPANMKSDVFVVNGNTVELSAGVLVNFIDPFNVKYRVITGATPIILDTNLDGKILTTGVSTARVRRAGTDMGKSVKFDFYNNNNPIEMEWIAGYGDAILVDNSDSNAKNNMHGMRLFGDDSGKYANGYKKLATKDSNNNGLIDGDELNDLLLWFDNGNAKVDSGELRTFKEVGIVSINTKFKVVKNKRGESLLQSEATASNGRKILTEDVWFMSK